MTPPAGRLLAQGPCSHCRVLQRLPWCWAQPLCCALAMRCCLSEEWLCLWCVHKLSSHPTLLMVAVRQWNSSWVATRTDSTGCADDMYPIQGVRHEVAFNWRQCTLLNGASRWLAVKAYVSLLPIDDVHGCYSSSYCQLGKYSVR